MRFVVGVVGSEELSSTKSTSFSSSSSRKCCSACACAEAVGDSAEARRVRPLLPKLTGGVSSSFEVLDPILFVFASVKKKEALRCVLILHVPQTFLISLGSFHKFFYRRNKHENSYKVDYQRLKDFKLRYHLCQVYKYEIR